MHRFILIVIVLVSRFVTMLATSFTFDESGRVIATWKINDVVGFYTVDGARIGTVVYGIDASEAHRASLTGNGWYMTSGGTYYG